LLICVAPFYLVFHVYQQRHDVDEVRQEAEKAGWDLNTLDARTEEVMRAAVDKFFDVVLIRAVLIFVCISPFAGYALAYGRRLRSKSGTEAMADDPRPPVVYFRSFEDDDRPAYEGLAAAFSPFRWGRTQEEEIVQSLQGLGPVVAIGNPKESTPLAGAARLYIRHEDWRAVAHQLLEEAALVVYRQGLTPGLVWEIGRGRQVLQPHRVLLVILDIANYDSFRQILWPIFELPPRKELRVPLITFDSAWKPITFNTISWAERLTVWTPRSVSKCVATFVRARLQAHPPGAASPSQPVGPDTNGTSFWLLTHL
jgi:hypothetical protein